MSPPDRSLRVFLCMSQYLETETIGALDVKLVA
jgi:hypothetical protein